MKAQTCPFDKKTPCEFLKDENTIVHNCDFCTVYTNTHPEDSDPLDGTKMIGCLGAGIIGLILIGIGLFALINYVRQV